MNGERENAGYNKFRWTTDGVGASFAVKPGCRAVPGRPEERPGMATGSDHHDRAIGYRRL
jgi:hypothetical protein